MSNPYREIFRAPGARGFSAAGFFARLPIAMAPIGIVAMLSQTLGVIALTSLPLLVAGSSVTLLAAAVFVSGIAISPTFITAFGLIERRVPESMLTEGVTWVMTGIGIGMALGAFVSGWVVDNYGPENGFWVSVAAGAVTVGIIALGQRTISGDCTDGADCAVLEHSAP